MTAKKKLEPNGQAEIERWLIDHGDALYRYARARVRRREAAEDLVQETFLAALRANDRFAGRSSPFTWLTAILKRKIADYYRRAETTSTHSVDPNGDPVLDAVFDERGFWRNAPSAWQSPAQIAQEREFQAVLDDCLHALPPHLARPFLLRELDGQPMAAITAALELTAGNLRVRLHRARLLLRGCLERNWFGDGIRSTEAP